MNTIELSPKSDNGASKSRPAEDFWALYHEWLRVRGSETTDEEKMTANSDRADELARLIMVTPAPRPDCVFLKFVILEHYVSEECEAGIFTDCRTIWMPACIKADIMSLGLKDDFEERVKAFRAERQLHDESDAQQRAMHEILALRSPHLRRPNPARYQLCSERSDKEALAHEARGRYAAAQQ